MSLRPGTVCALACALFIGCIKGNTMCWPPKDVEAVRFEGLEVPGMELYVLHEETAPHRRSGAARLEDSSGYLRGKEAFDAARARLDDDPTALAILSMLFLERGGGEGVAGKMPWTEDTQSPQVPEQQAIAEPPKLSGDTLEYWRFHEQLADLVFCRASLTTGEVSCELGGEILHAAAMEKDPMAAIEEDLAADDVYAVQRGIEALEELGTADARQRLIDIALSEDDPRLRAFAAESLANVGGPGVADALRRVLLDDTDAEPRRAAAAALGTLGDPAGRSALEQVLEQAVDVRVKLEAERALKKLEAQGR